MRFQEWLINEISWHNFDKPITINDVMADGIDFHFEDWKKGANPNKTSAMMPAVDPTKYINNSFSAPLWDGGYINVSRERVPDVGMTHAQWKELSPSLRIPGAEVSQEAKFEKLPIFWFEFAALYLNGKKVKEQMWPRDGQDQDVSSFNMMFRKAEGVEPQDELLLNVVKRNLMMCGPNESLPEKVQSVVSRMYAYGGTPTMNLIMRYDDLEKAVEDAIRIIEPASR